MDITLVPYFNIRGKSSIDDSVLIKAWNKLVEDEIHTTVFYDATIRSEQQFMGLMKDTQNAPVFILIDGMVGGLAWLTGISTKFAFGHFAFFKSTWGKYTKQMGEKVIKYWLEDLVGDNGNPILDTIIGVIPDFNKKAISFVKDTGFTELGTIPEFVRCPYIGERRGVTFLYRQR